MWQFCFLYFPKEVFFVDKNNVIWYSFCKLDNANHLKRGVFLLFMISYN